MKAIVTLTFAAVSAFSLTACSDPAAQREAECVGGTLGGAALGGLVGNQIGRGTGNALATAVGAAAGGAIAATQMNC